ncbi:hypothetical protein [Sphingomonas sediminicola]|nr:hypothetical protein [Sphingomonas sediminicola]
MNEMKQEKISGEPTAVDERTAEVAADAVGEPGKKRSAGFVRC